MKIPFVGAAYQERSTKLDAQLCINFFPVKGESGTAKDIAALYGTPGTRPLVSASDGAVRGMHQPTNGSDGIVVIGSTIYRLDSSFVLRSIGTCDALTTPVKIDDNGFQAVIVTGPNGYQVDLVLDTVTQITDPAFYGADNVDFLDTYAIFNRPGTNQFYISGSNEITFDALDFATAESNFEKIVNFVVDHDELILFKLTVTEIWRGSSNPDFPFARDKNASIELGCAARDSVAKMDSTVFWLAQDNKGTGMVYRLNGYSPVRVSTDAVDSAIASYSDISDAVAYSYQQEGHSFYVLSFPTGNATWVYDANTQLWHQRAYLDPDTGTLGRHRSNSHMYFAKTHIVGDYENGSLYALDLDYYMDGEDPLPSIRVSPHIAGQDYQWIMHDRVQIDIEAGVGISSGQGSQPVALLDWSDDAGKNWSNQHVAYMGAIGEYSNRLRWSQVGRSRDRIYRLTISDPVKRVIVGATLNPKT
jgi:hypothetical protein